MARIRTIKPELYTDSKLIKLSIVARYVFTGLLTQCDRRGRFKWDDTELQLRILPRDEDIGPFLTELIKAGVVKRYGASKEFGCVPKFEEHQVINIREPESKLPDENGKYNVGTVPEQYEYSTGIEEGRKEGRNKERRKEGTTGEKSPEENKQIAEIIDLWGKAFNDPEMVKKWYTIKTERMAVATLIKRCQGFDKLKGLIEHLPDLISRPYYPSPTKPSELNRDLQKLVAKVKQDATNNKQAIKSGALPTVII